MKNFQDLSVSDYLRILRRRVWYFVVPAVLISAGACVFAWQQASFYKSETTIQVANRLVPDDYIGSLVRETPTDRIEFVRQQIRSRSFIARLVEDLQLAGGQANVDAVISTVLANVSIDVIAPTTFKLGYVAQEPALAQSVVKRLSERVMQLNENFRKDIVLGADQFLDEALRQAETELAAAEERLRLFNEQQFRGLPAQVDALSLTTLQTQLVNADSELADLMQSREAARRRLQDQRDLLLAGRTATPPAARRPPPTATAPKPVTVGPSPLELQLTALQAELARMSSTHPNRPRVQRQVDDLTRQIAELKRQPEAFSAVPEEVASNPEASSVLPVLPELDTVVEFAEAELKFELERLDRVIATKERARQALMGQIAQAQRRLNPSPEVAQEMAAINQDLKSARERQALLSNRKLSSELAAQVDTNAANETFRVIDAANLPLAPFGPNRTRNALMGSIMGILLGLGFVAAREFLDTTLRDEEEASAMLKIPVLTSVPVVPGMAKKKLLQRFRGAGSDSSADPPEETAPLRLGKVELVNPGLEPAATFSLQSVDSRVRSVILDYRTIAGEQYRLMRTTLSLMRKKRDKLQTILIASTIPNEGKTFAACCLAAILAQESRQRVLLIDADFRTASASEMLGLNGNAPKTGLCDVLRGEAQIESSVVECSELNLYFLPAGGTVTDPTELLASSALEATIRRCEELFDWIIIDSPPILALADANIMLPVCDSALLVIRAGKTPAKLVKDSVSRIGDDRICGVLMNGVRFITPSRYYGNYYKYNS